MALMQFVGATKSLAKFYNAITHINTQYPLSDKKCKSRDWKRFHRNLASADDDMAACLFS